MILEKYRACTRYPVLTPFCVLGASILAVHLFAAEPEKTAIAQIGSVKPEIFEVEPRGIQIGTTNRFKVTGTNLIGVTELKLHNSKLSGALLNSPEGTSNSVWLEIAAASDIPRGTYEISVKNTNAESSRLKLHVDDLPQYSSTAVESGAKSKPIFKLPISVWGVIDRPGEADEIAFEADAGDSLVFDLAAKSIGSKASVLLTLLDDHGSVLASNSGLDNDDPLLQFRILNKGKYHLRIADRTDAGSKDHFYRVSVGNFPMVIGVFPLGIPANQETDVQLIGFNLPTGKMARIKAGAPGELEVPIEPKFHTRRLFKVVVNEGPEFVEHEPNENLSNATHVAIGSAIDGRIDLRPGQQADTDLYEFEGRRDQTIVLETDAARRGSPIDTKIEVLDAQGKPVERLLLEAVRDSHVTFRSVDSNAEDLRVENWQEMELNQLMYLQGEVCKIYRMPQGPDSGFQFYSSGGKRRNYFDTSPVAHALEEPAYIVEPHPPGSASVPNGLPVFTIYYANDDDADRILGSDSKLLFTPPLDGKYFVRVGDTRGNGGERFVYRLLLYDAKPDFKVTITGVEPTIAAGAGKEFIATATRIDGFDGDIRLEISGLPKGFSALTPLVIQAGHLVAKGTINAAADATAPSESEATSAKVTATAMIHGQTTTREVNGFGKMTLASKPKLFVAVEPYDEAQTNFVERSNSAKPLEITIAPGQSIPAWLKIKRNGHDDLVTFTLESLPHGVIVDNIGLNGVLIPKGQDARRIFLTAAKWVPEVDRLFYAKAVQAESPTSLPILLHVRKLPNLSQKTP